MKVIKINKKPALKDTTVQVKFNGGEIANIAEWGACQVEKFVFYDKNNPEDRAKMEEHQTAIDGINGVLEKIT